MGIKKEDYEKYIGKYVRNQFGIAKILDIIKDNDIFFMKLDNAIVYNPETNKIIGDLYPIIEQSNFTNRIKDLIDLIEVDDIVNEEFVDKIKEDEDGKYIKTYFNNVYRNKDIKSIVTKELYKSVEYEVNNG